MKLRAFVTFMLCGVSMGLTYWVAPDIDGVGGGDGSISNPYRSFQTAIKEKGGGNTFIFKDGLYAGKQINVYAGYRGLPQQPTVLKSETKYGAQIHGSIAHGIYIYPGADWVIIDGFAVSGSAIDGIKSNADYTVVRNCWVRNNLSMGIAAHNVKGAVFERNIVEYNGSHLQFEHGFYVDGSGIVIRDNLCRFNASAGMNLVPSIAGAIIENNLIYGNSRSGIIACSSKSNGKNRFLNNTIYGNSGGLIISNSESDIVCNNIICNNAGLWTWSETRYSDIEIREYRDPNTICMKANLYESISGMEAGEHLVDSPEFERAIHGWFWLKKNSPAIGAGTSEYYAKKDFYGNDRDPDKIDLGCFNYNEGRLGKKYRDSWYLEWPYNNRIAGGGLTIPDLWEVPQVEDNPTK